MEICQPENLVPGWCEDGIDNDCDGAIDAVGLDEDCLLAGGGCGDGIVTGDEQCELPGANVTSISS